MDSIKEKRNADGSDAALHAATAAAAAGTTPASKAQQARAALLEHNPRESIAAISRDRAPFLSPAEILEQSAAPARRAHDPLQQPQLERHHAPDRMSGIGFSIPSATYTSDTGCSVPSATSVVSVTTPPTPSLIQEPSHSAPTNSAHVTPDKSAISLSDRSVVTLTDKSPPASDYPSQDRRASFSTAVSGSSCHLDQANSDSEGGTHTGDSRVRPHSLFDPGPLPSCKAFRFKPFDSPFVRAAT